jgi:hypothetical protein
MAAMVSCITSLITDGWFKDVIESKCVTLRRSGRKSHRHNVASRREQIFVYSYSFIATIRSFTQYNLGSILDFLPTAEESIF